MNDDAIAVGAAAAEGHGYEFAGVTDRRLFEQLHAWSNANCTCPQDAAGHRSQCYVAAVFSAFCAPEQATPDEVFISAKCALLFFLVDDGLPGQLTEFDRLLATGGDPQANEPTACLASVLEDLHARGCETRWFHTTVRAWASSMRHEQTLDIRDVTPEEYHVLRRETIFVSCMVACWMSLARISTPAKLLAARAELLELAIRIVTIVNDLGSLQADAALAEVTEAARGGLVAINTILLRERVLGSRERAVSEAMNHHGALVEGFRTRGHDLAGDRHAGQQVPDLLTVLRAVINGNLQGTRHLTAERYPGGAQLLQRLEFV
ncbi:terpene synthase family protein [Streptomyces sp. PTM05]|uniref:Terpene synthase family protein n=1 Tax=Streptantibioticus parmotrematis TaxID=2873249 RepID=A0ABS7QUX6_9ACTN|nr:terpene synthase family protein [Streptantibioticus parmotrematis]MBY8887017.1 terpene synthase family protein [Streptantibioticus parmotrematis]